MTSTGSIRVTVRDLLLLLAACLLLYCTGLDLHGVTNWQEAQRVVVARDMQARIAAGEEGAWIVPRHNGQAYIAKPPVVYWVTIGLAGARGGTVELFDLRLAVALAGTLGVLGTYVVALSLLRPLGEPGARAGARWAAVFLATGVLYFRSARIGELDIMLVPSVVGAVGCVWMAWRAQLRAGAPAGVVGVFGLRAKWGWIVLGAVLAAIATLTKGPPALMVIALAGYGAIVLWSALGEDNELGEFGDRGGWWAGVIAGVVFAAFGARGVRGPGDVVGVVLLGLIGAMLALIGVRLATRRRAMALWHGLAHTHPIVVLGVPALVFWWWGHSVSALIGPELAVSLAKEQADNDLNLLTPSSPLKNLEALAYGCGAGSVVMLLGAVWWVRQRPGVRRVSAGVLVPVAWVVLSFAALSLFGKGVARYFTPVWPGVAILAGAWVVRRRAPGESVREVGPRRGGWVVLVTACVVLGAAQAWWYGWGREAFESERSPRAIMRALSEREAARRYGSFEFYTPALDYYAGSYVQPIVNAQMGVAVAGGAAWTLEELAADVRANGPMVVLCREWSLDRSLPVPAERLRAAGLRVREVAGLPEFLVDNKRAAVRAVVVE